MVNNVGKAQMAKHHRKSTEGALHWRSENGRGPRRWSAKERENHGQPILLPTTDLLVVASGTNLYGSIERTREEMGTAVCISPIPS
jgi:hypothetical protein